MIDRDKVEWKKEELLGGNRYYMVPSLDLVLNPTLDGGWTVFDGDESISDIFYDLEQAKGELLSELDDRLEGIVRSDYVGYGAM